MRLFDSNPLRTTARALTTATLAVACSLALVSTAQAAGSIVLYENSLKSSAGRDEVRQFGNDTCKRGGSSKAFRATVGKKTRECFYRTQTVGRDLDISISARLFKSTPKKVRAQAYVAVNLRQARDGSRYQLAVYPSGGRFHLKKVLDNGRILDLEHGKLGNKIKGFDEANKLRLSAYNDVAGVASGTARLVAFINGNKVAVVDDPRGNLLQGQDTTFSIGSKKNATGAIGSFTSLTVRAPDPF
ncbi:MAG TPA: hypothetical protein VMF31_07435 [Solirubrobacterales bacterium]|nr:hypothetical protein [Solirubrobacterales bacterium]